MLVQAQYAGSNMLECISSAGDADECCIFLMVVCSLASHPFPCARYYAHVNISVLPERGIERAAVVMKKNRRRRR